MLRVSELQAEASRLGFLLTGVAAPPSPPSTYKHYSQWIASGAHASMDYLATDRAHQSRREPGLLLPGCRTIIVLAYPYPSPVLITPLNVSDQSEPSQAPRGQIAAYAWEKDYHDTIPLYLAALAEWLRQKAPQAWTWRGYTDTGPILERDAAQHAGLGWAGKNTCLINPLEGSFFFLAEMLTDFDIEPSPPFESDRCGSCQRCIKACPTGCIQPNRTLDARRCIAYQTIENKGIIPLELRPLFGAWIFGCDICQMVCPWNARATRQASPLEARRFKPSLETAFPNLSEVLQLTPQQFSTRFRGTPVQRTRRRGYLRNATIAAGNTHNPALVPALVNLLESEPEALIRAHAAWALGQIHDHAAHAALEKCLHSETIDAVQAEILAALAQPSG